MVALVEVAARLRAATSSSSRRKRRSELPGHGQRAPSRGRNRGQALVEFALVVPLFLVLLMGVIEFGFGLNASLALGYASRDAALIATEAGNTSGADCMVLRSVEEHIGAPANPAQITSVEIYWSDQNGALKNGAKNVYTRTGTTTCSYAGGATITVPYTATSIGYADSIRCNVLAGCGGAHTPSVDTIGVKITYSYSFKTPLRGLIGLLGGPGWSSTGWSLSSSNAMRMEPVL